MTPDDLSRISAVLKRHISPLLPAGSDAVVVIVTGHRLEPGECGEVEFNVTSTMEDKEADKILLLYADVDDEGEEWKKR